MFDINKKMTLLDISDASLSKVYGCLVKKPQTYARFARTSYRISEVAEQRRCLKKEILELQITYEKELEMLTADLIDESGVLIHDEMRVYRSVSAKMRIILKKQVKKCASIAEFVLHGFVITEEVLSSIREILAPIVVSSNFQMFTFRFCKFECNENKLFQTMSCLNVKSLSMVHVDLKSVRISSMHISLVTDSIEIYPDSVYESDIDDQILTNWLYKLPSLVDFDAFSTQITLNGVLTFIKKLSEQLYSKPAGDRMSHFYLGKVKSEEEYEENLALLLRNPSITWKIKNNIDGIGYTVTIDSKLTIIFHHSCKNYSRITKRQASNKVTILRAKIVEKRRLDPAYDIYDDEPLNAELMELLRMINPEWTDLKDELEDLEMMQINPWDEEKEEDLIE